VDLAAEVHLLVKNLLWSKPSKKPEVHDVLLRDRENPLNEKRALLSMMSSIKYTDVTIENSLSKNK
jgi:hypothetical protein